MPKSHQCPACFHPQANEITKRLLAGDTIRQLEREYGVNKASLSRHKRKCLFHADIVKRKRDELAKNVVGVFDRLEKLSDRFDDAMRAAEKDGQLGYIGAFGRELRETLKSIHDVGKDTQVADFAMNIVDQALPERCPHCNARLTQ